jgi:hypothetical protein
MNKEETLIKYRGQLKYIKEKYIKRINLIDKYLSRLESETLKEKDARTYKEEKEYNKDLIIELDRLFYDLGE